jgi:two-component sensor histidine kinase
MGGVVCIDHDSMHVLSRSNGLRSERIMSLYEDADGALWIGTRAGGLARFKNGTISCVADVQDLIAGTIYSIMDDGLGNMWMSSDNGIFRISKKELNAVCDGLDGTVHCVAYGTSDGIRNDECNGGMRNAVMQTRDGALWYPTNDGFVRVKPSELPLTMADPSVVIEEVVIDKKPIMQRDSIIFEPGTRVVEFSYAGPSFTAPEKIRYSTLLEGFDTKWMDMGARRWASYTNIPPGCYRFRVRAMNEDGRMSPHEAAFSFTMTPHYYETQLFLAAAVMGIGLGGAALYKLYRHRKESVLLASRLHAQMEAKLKQAQLSALSMQLEPHFLFNTLNTISSLIHEDAAQADRMVTNLGEMLRSTLDTIRRQEIRLRQELNFIECYLSIEKARLGNRLHIITDIEPETLDAMIPCMIWQPFVENAVKHAIAPRISPGTIMLRARKIGSSLELQVRDSGRGIPDTFSFSRSSGVGIRNTLDRLELLFPKNHDISFVNNNGGGLSVTFTIPFRMQKDDSNGAGTG